MGTKFFVAYLALWAVICIVGGLALLKNYFEASILPCIGGFFLLGMGSVYAGMFLLGMKAILKKDKKQQ